MKKLIALLLCGLILLTGCAPEKESSATIPPVIPTVKEIPQMLESSTDLVAVSLPASTERFTLEDGTEIFSYTAQHMELILPNEEIADRVILDFLNRVDRGRSNAEDILASAQTEVFSNESFYPYFYHSLYSPYRIDLKVLSLFGTQNSYSGGIHGNLSCMAANYDLQTGDVLTLASIMRAEAQQEDIIQLVLDSLSDHYDDYCLYEDYEMGVRARLETDANLYEDFYFTTTGLCFFFAPYEIAPYASGVITVELPYEKVSHLMYEGYLPEKKPIMEGLMQTGSFMDMDMEQFTNMAEVTLSSGEAIMVAYPIGSVEDIRVHVAGDEMNIPDYTAFAAYEMSDQDAVVISLTDADISRISVEYFDGTEMKTIPLSNES